MLRSFKRYRPIITLVCCLAATALCAYIISSSVPSPPAIGQEGAISKTSNANATVQDVVDGDTISVKIIGKSGKSGKSEKVRMIGIDTPESVDPRRPVGCFGKEASTFTKSLLPKHTQIRLELDVEARDAFHRILAYVYRASDNLFINAELARNGFATTLTRPPNVTLAAELRTYVTEARDSGKGLWGSCPPIPLK